MLRQELQHWPSRLDVSTVRYNKACHTTVNHIYICVCVLDRSVLGSLRIVPIVDIDRSSFLRALLIDTNSRCRPDGRCAYTLDQFNSLFHDVLAHPGYLMS